MFLSNQQSMVKLFMAKFDHSTITNITLKM